MVSRVPMLSFKIGGKQDPQTFPRIILLVLSLISVYFFTLAGSAGYLPFLHYHIFGLQKQDCMNFSVQIKVMPLKELLDPQGKAVMGGLQNLGIKTVQDVRIGKTIQLQVEAASSDEAKKIAEDASRNSGQPGDGIFRNFSIYKLWNLEYGIRE